MGDILGILLFIIIFGGINYWLYKTRQKTVFVDTERYYHLTDGGNDVRSQPKFCPNCGTAYDSEGIFCSSCGVRQDRGDDNV